MDLKTKNSNNQKEKQIPRILEKPKTLTEELLKNMRASIDRLGDDITK